MEAFDKAVKISTTPATWNTIAYLLAQKGAHLDVARRYAESAVSSTATRLRNLTLDQLKQADLGLTSALGSYWDTLGWVAFAEGHLDVAKKYVLAGSELGQDAEEGDHMGQICEKSGDKESAVHWYALALSARRPEQETRGRLAALAGGDDKVDALVAKYQDEFVAERTLKFKSAPKQDGRADFFLLLGGGASVATVEDVKFISCLLYTSIRDLGPHTSEIVQILATDESSEGMPYSELKRRTKVKKLQSSLNALEKAGLVKSPSKGRYKLSSRALMLYLRITERSKEWRKAAESASENDGS